MAIVALELEIRLGTLPLLLEKLGADGIKRGQILSHSLGMSSGEQQIPRLQGINRPERMEARHGEYQGTVKCHVDVSSSRLDHP